MRSFFALDKRRGRLTILGVLLVGIGVAGALGVTASEQNPKDGPEGPSPPAPVKTVPPAEQLAPGEPISRDALPRLVGSEILLLPPGSDVPVTYEYGDERDSWTWSQETASGPADLPKGDGLVRVPQVPDAFRLAEIVYTIGRSTDGTQTQLSELHFSYEAQEQHPITVSLRRPTELAQGKPIPVVVEEDGVRETAVVTLKSGHRAVYSFQPEESQASGRQTLLVVDGDVLIVVDTFRGQAFEVLAGIAESLISQKSQE